MKTQGFQHSCKSQAWQHRSATSAVGREEEPCVSLQLADQIVQPYRTREGSFTSLLLLCRLKQRDAEGLGHVHLSGDRSHRAVTSHPQRSISSFLATTPSFWRSACQLSFPPNFLFRQYSQKSKLEAQWETATENSSGENRADTNLWPLYTWACTLVHTQHTHQKIK